MKRKSWRPAVMVFALAASMMTARAEEYTGSTGWAATFTGEKIESNFSSSQIADAVSELQPGDSVTINVDVENKDSQTADFYLTNQVLTSLEDSRNTASGGAYGYRLAYTDPSGAETVLYNSEAVGGEDKSRGEGLHKAVSGMEEFIYLDGLTSGQKGKISLRVELDGETQGNGYQNTFASLQLNFAVERAAEAGGGEENGARGSSGTNGTGGTTLNKTEPAQSGALGSGAGTALFTQDGVYTGDASRLLLWSSAALASGLGLLFYALRCYLKRTREGRP